MVSYVCSDCGEKEDTPEQFLEYLDEINPARLIFGEHQFTCEKCNTGIIKPENEIKSIVKGVGLFDRLNSN